MPIGEANKDYRFEIEWSKYLNQRAPDTKIKNRSQSCFKATEHQMTSVDAVLTLCWYVGGSHI